MLFLFFIMIPVLEIAGFIVIGDMVGFWMTIALILITAMIGSSLLRKQGLDTLNKIQEVSAQGGLPLDEMLDGACLVVAGILLVTPGFLTDALGFLLFVPVFRAFAKEIFVSGQFLTIVNFTQNQNHRRSGQSGFQQSQTSRPPQAEDGDIIDGDYEIVEEKDKLS